MSIHNVSFLILGVVGLLLQGLGTSLIPMAKTDEVLTLSVVLAVLGPIVLFAGSSIYALGKKRSWAFGLLGLVSPIGLLFLAVLEDRSGS